jgi:hypothetical protein
MTNEQQQLLKELKELKQKLDDGGVSSRHGIHGICFQLRTGVGDIFENLCKKWPKYSGYPAYPIPATEFESPAEQYERGEKWKGKQRKLRLELIGFCINRLENERT